MINNPLQVPHALASPLAIALLAFSIFTTTFTSYHHSLSFLRLLLAIPSTVLWLSTIYPAEDYGRTPLLITAIWGGYGFMKMLDVCVAGFWDEEKDVPRWVVLDAKVGRSNTDDKPKRIGRTLLPLPSTLWDRLVYTVDYLLAARGGSLFPDRAWTWTPESYCATLTASTPSGYRHFYSRQLKKILPTLLAIDLTDNLMMNTHQFDKTRPDPITSLSPPLQVLYTLTIGAQMTFTLFFAIDSIATVLIPLLCIKPETWRPHYGPNLQATSSLGQLWANGWHITFRRVFDRISSLIISPIQPFVAPSLLKLIRLFVVFGISGIWHTSIPVVLWPFDIGRNLGGFWDWNMLGFFLVQPVGVLIEAYLINPVTEALPGRWKVWARRGFFWSWIIWTGRWYSNAYIRWGPYDELALGNKAPFALLFCRLGFRALEGSVKLNN